MSYYEIVVPILYRQVPKLRTKNVASVKVLSSNQFVEEATWEAGEDMKKKYSHFFESGENVDQRTNFLLSTIFLMTDHAVCLQFHVGYLKLILLLLAW